MVLGRRAWVLAWQSPTPPNVLPGVFSSNSCWSHAFLRALVACFGSAITLHSLLQYEDTPCLLALIFSAARTSSAPADVAYRVLLGTVGLGRRHTSLTPTGSPPLRKATHDSWRPGLYLGAIPGSMQLT
ncbi:hypothetical protein BS50DRAFT_51432 [Corynespora cassiicola Philippines]|uniref:Uncharacterized protein n=1 Tax=Corynespora cassiicola Philippines TaxID=1448308 RepID=A0A2T2NI52_CORCC|nr:hypothetical protein BS50DRAFT_51432 [Corynespora cassiicola Philippines]